MTNTKLLEKRIKDSGLKKSYIAKVLGISPKTLTHKINNRTGFYGCEISAMCKLLGITDESEKNAIFFVE